MPRMSDEQWSMIEDSISKKNIARSSRNKRTNCGKRGGVRLPSDFMTKKELKAMNGEVKTYKLHDPMTWSEFKDLPDDLKKEYVKYIRQRFKATDTALADAFGISLSHFCKLTKKLGLPSGRSHSAIGKRWYKSEERKNFEKWWYGEEYETLDNDISEEVRTDTENSKEDILEEESAHIQVQNTAIKVNDINSNSSVPNSGRLEFTCEAFKALDMVKQILGSANVSIDISWTVN